MADDWTVEETAEVVSVEVKLFGRWNPDDVQINDISLAVSNLCLFNACVQCLSFFLINAHRHPFVRTTLQ